MIKCFQILHPLCSIQKLFAITNIYICSNYGTQNIGLDWLFGTFAARESDVKGLCDERFTCYKEGPVYGGGVSQERRGERERVCHESDGGCGEGMHDGDGRGGQGSWAEPL